MDLMSANLTNDLLIFLKKALKVLGESPEYCENFLSSIFTILSNYIDSNATT